jgi:hypothetical protein
MQFPLNPRPPQSCDECAFFRLCGGLEGEAFSQGCFQRCSSKCLQKGCDVACPGLHLTFPDLLEDVGGLCSPPSLPLQPYNGAFSHYIPQIDHGSSRAAALNEDVVVIPLTALIQKDKRGRLRVRYTSPETL